MEWWSDALKDNNLLERPAFFREIELIAVGVLEPRDVVGPVRRVEHLQRRFAGIGEAERLFYLLFEFAQIRHLKP